MIPAEERCVGGERVDWRSIGKKLWQARHRLVRHRVVTTAIEAQVDHHIGRRVGLRFIKDVHPGNHRWIGPWSNNSP